MARDLWIHFTGHTYVRMVPGATYSIFPVVGLGFELTRNGQRVSLHPDRPSAKKAAQADIEKRKQA